MISQEQNELMTRVGPGTPAGKLLRNYWMNQRLKIIEEKIEGRCQLRHLVIGDLAR